jgi:hypothetical protein
MAKDDYIKVRIPEGEKQEYRELAVKAGMEGGLSEYAREAMLWFKREALKRAERREKAVATA